MELKTKYNVGQTVVAIKDHKCTEFKISSISTHSFESDRIGACTIITYYGNETSEGQKPFYADEANCFPSKDEYINQL